MLVGAFNLGWAELLIIFIVGGLLILSLVIVGVVLFALLLRSKKQPGNGSWTPSEPQGQPMRIRLLGPADKPIADSARWNTDELQVKSDGAATKSLFEVPLDNLDQCVITYRFRITTDNLQSAIYPEMWCRVPGKGEFFSRGLNCKVRGTNDWKDVEIPFYLQAGQRADLLKLNLVFEGPGTVKLKDIEVLATPTKPSQ